MKEVYQKAFVTCPAFIGLIATMKAEQGMDPSITDDAARFQSANIGTEVAALEARITGRVQSSSLRFAT